jgi:hypothetical protein
VKNKKEEKLVVGSIDIQVLLAFGFGVIFIITALAFSISTPNPSPFSQWVFITVLALASAGAGAVIPGLIRIQLPYASAGGALALFVIVFATKPAIVGTIVNLIEPKHDPLPTIQAFLGRIDTGRVEEAWQSMDNIARAGPAQDLDQIRKIYANARAPLGDVRQRTEIGANLFYSPAGYPIGVYRLATFRTHFLSGQCYLEKVLVRANDKLEWNVYDHNIDPHSIAC